MTARRRICQKGSSAASVAVAAFLAGAAHGQAQTQAQTQAQAQARGQSQAPAPPPAVLAPYAPTIIKDQAAGDWRGVEQTAGAALADVSAREGADSLDAATVLFWLGNAQQQQGKYAEAEAAFRRSLAIDQAKLPPGDINTASEQLNTAAVLMAENRPAEAEPLARSAAATLEARIGPVAGPTLSALACLSRSLDAQGKTADAQAILARLQAVDETTAGVNQTTVSALVAVAQQFWMKPKEAEPFARHAQAIGEKTLAPDSAPLAYLDWLLGGVYQNEGRARDSEPLLTRAVDIDVKVLGPDNPSTGAAGSPRKLEPAAWKATADRRIDAERSLSPSGGRGL